MEDKLKVLTDKLLNEGVKKGEDEAKEIVAKAKSEAEKIIADAKAEAEKILSSAKSKSDEQMRKTEADLKMAASQSVSLLKNKISDLVSSNISNENVSGSFDNAKFVQGMIMSLLESWAKDGGQVSDINLYLPKVDKNDLNAFIKKNCKSFLDKGVELEVSEEIKTGFKVGPKDGSFVVEFSDDSFKAFFKEFLKPAIRELVF